MCKWMTWYFLISPRTVLAQNVFKILFPVEILHDLEILSGLVAYNKLSVFEEPWTIKDYSKYPSANNQTYSHSYFDKIANL